MLDPPDDVHTMREDFELLASSLRALFGVSLLQSDGARLHQRFEVGEDLRPAARYRRDQLGRIALDGVRYGELDRSASGFQLHRAQRVTFGLELGILLVPPANHQTARWLGLDDLPGIGDTPVAGDHLPRGSSGPLALAVHAEPILLHEFGVGES